MVNRKSTRKMRKSTNVKNQKRKHKSRGKSVKRKSVKRKSVRRKSQKRGGYVKRKTRAKRHTKRNKRRNYKKRRRMKGGSCAMRSLTSPANLGKMFTGVAPIKNVLAYPESSNTHNVPHISPGKAMHIGGGSLLRSIGLGDILQAKYGVEDNLQSSYNVLKGDALETSSNVMKAQYNKL